MDEVERLRNYLEWLITPQDAEEQALFAGVVDDYIELRSKIPAMTKEELIAEIDIQLKPYGLSYAPTP